MTLHKNNREKEASASVIMKGKFRVYTTDKGTFFLTMWVLSVKMCINCDIVCAGFSSTHDDVTPDDIAKYRAAKKEKAAKKN